MAISQLLISDGSAIQLVVAAPELVRVKLNGVPVGFELTDRIDLTRETAELAPLVVPRRC
jgi:hypothetical protein